jgi:predicted  nucleic acid-binding Zn-ribbon protein
MHPQLELLLELQDLQSQRRALREEGDKHMEEEVFDLRPVEALQILDGKIAELTERLDPSVRTRYLDVVGALVRAVVPVINGICYGCFVATPTAWSTEARRNDHITICDHCGRFLYYVD